MHYQVVNNKYDMQMTWEDGTISGVTLPKTINVMITTTMIWVRDE